MLVKFINASCVFMDGNSIKVFRFAQLVSILKYSSSRYSKRFTVMEILLSMEGERNANEAIFVTLI